MTTSVEQRQPAHRPAAIFSRSDDVPTDLDEFIKSIEVAGSATEGELNDLLAHLDLSSALGQSIAATVAEISELDPDLQLGRPGDLKVTFEDHDMTVIVEIMPPLGNAPPLAYESAIKRLKTAYKITSALDEIVLHQLVEDGARRVSRAVVARGQPAVRPESERWEEIKSGAATPDEYETGSVDMHAFASFTPIEPDQVLAVRIPAVAGRCGLDVRGELVDPQECVNHPDLIAGPGTEKREEGIFATLAGEVRREGNILSVLSIRRIIGDVDYSTGNVTFPGAVIVTGSILDQFTVRCSGTLEVGGNIYAATVEAGGSIVVHGGIIGRDNATVRSEGDIRAKFIECARIEAKGNLIVNRGILHSEIGVLGRIEVLDKPGTVVGGVIQCGEGLHCRILGSVADTMTRVIFGENHLDRRRRMRIEEALGIQKKRIVEIDHALTRPALKVQPTIRQRLEDSRAHALGALQKLLSARIACLTHMKDGPAGDVRVKEEIFEGVVLASRGLEMRIDRNGVRARYRLQDDKIVLAAYD